VYVHPLVCTYSPEGLSESKALHRDGQRTEHHCGVVFRDPFVAGPIRKPQPLRGVVVGERSFTESMQTRCLSGLLLFPDKDLRVDKLIRPANVGYGQSLCEAGPDYRFRLRYVHYQEHRTSRGKRAHAGCSRPRPPCPAKRRRDPSNCIPARSPPISQSNFSENFHFYIELGISSL